MSVLRVCVNVFAVGPRLFLSCPMNATEAHSWFTDLWNYSIVPYLLEAQVSPSRPHTDRDTQTRQIDRQTDTYTHMYADIPSGGLHGDADGGNKGKKGKGAYSSLWIGNPSQRYGASPAIWDHSVTCYPTQVNAPRLNPSHAGRYSIYLPRRDGRLS